MQISMVQYRTDVLQYFSKKGNSHMQILIFDTVLIKVDIHKRP